MLDEPAAIREVGVVYPPSANEDDPVGNVRKPETAVPDAGTRPLPHPLSHAHLETCARPDSAPETGMPPNRINRLWLPRPQIREN